MVDGELSRPPVERELEIRFVSWGHGEAAFELTVSPRHLNGVGTVHGGVLATLADTTMVTALASSLSRGQAFMSLDLQLQFVRAVEAGTILAKGTVIDVRRRTGLVECLLEDSRGALIARASSRCLLLPSREDTAA
jgi:uncharacterized protein (TIGR00369 family)